MWIVGYACVSAHLPPRNSSDPKQKRFLSSHWWRTLTLGLYLVGLLTGGSKAFSISSQHLPKDLSRGVGTEVSLILGCLSSDFNSEILSTPSLQGASAPNPTQQLPLSKRHDVLQEQRFLAGDVSKSRRRLLSSFSCLNASSTSTFPAVKSKGLVTKQSPSWHRAFVSLRVNLVYA